MLINACTCMSTYMYTHCLYACRVCVKEEIGIEKERRGERERERKGGRREGDSPLV